MSYLCNDFDTMIKIILKPKIMKPEIKEMDIKNSTELKKLSEIAPATSESLLDNKIHTELSPNVAKLLKEKIEKKLERETDLIGRKMPWKDFVEKYL